MRSDASSINAILTSHETDYGPFSTQGVVAQELKEVFHDNIGWDHARPDQREALDLIANKLSRILNGNPDIIDHWIDIAGYALLIAQRLERDENEASPSGEGGQPNTPRSRGGHQRP